MDKKNNHVNILVVVRWPVGGIRTYMKYVYKRFNPDYYNFTFIGPDIEEFNVLSEDLPGNNITMIPVNDNHLYRNILKTLINEIRTNCYDLIHSHGFTSGLLVSLISYFNNVPHIMTTHDVFLEGQFRGLKKTIKKKIISHLFRKINVIQTVSVDAKENMLETFPELDNANQKILAICNGIDIDEFITNESVDLRKQLTLSNNTILIGFLGRFMAQKGFRYLVEATEKIIQKNSTKKSPVVIAVGSDGFQRQEQLNVINKNLDNNIKFLPFEKNISKIINGLDVIVMPSLFEACPLLPMEALISGVPIITSNCIGLREVVRDTPALIFESKDIDKLVTHLVSMINDYDSQPFIDFIPTARKRFDVNNTYAKLKDLYSETLSNK